MVWNYLFGPAAYEVTAGEEVEKLGLILDGHLPGHLHAKFVTPGKWADSVGIRPGFIIQKANGDDLAEMDAADFKAHLRARPLILLVQPADLEEGDEEHGRQIRASEAVGELGLHLSGLPPGNLTVREVVQDSWADNAGVVVSDRVIKINGVDVGGMDGDAFMEAWRARPLTIWLEPLFHKVTADDAVGKLGFSLTGPPPGHRRVSEVVPEHWAELAGLQVGQMLVKVNGEDLATMTGKQFMDFLVQRPLTLSFLPPGVQMGDDDPQGREVIAGPRVGKLGLMLTGLPPGRQLVQDVSPDSWAELAGIYPGEEVILANGEPLEGMSAQTFLAHLAERPLRLWIDPQPGKSPPAPAPPPATEEAGAQEAHVEEQWQAPGGGLEIGADLGEDFEGEVRAEEFEVVAGEDVDRLGLILNGIPPGEQEVSDLRGGLWAAATGAIEAGDVVVQLNGEPLFDMEPERFKELLRLRPLRIRFRPAGVEDPQLSFGWAKTVGAVASASVDGGPAAEGESRRCEGAQGAPRTRRFDFGPEPDFDKDDFEDYTLHRVIELTDELDQLRSEHARMRAERAMWKADHDKFLQARAIERMVQARANMRQPVHPVLFALKRSGRKHRHDTEYWGTGGLEPRRRRPLLPLRDDNDDHDGGDRFGGW